MKRILVVASVLVVVCAGALSWYLWPRRYRYYTDGDLIRQSARTAVVREILWQPPRMVAEVINSGADDYEPRLSADGQTLFFVRGRAGQNADIYYSQRTGGGWAEPAPVPGINSEHEELGPEPSSDGQALYFYSDRPGGLGGYDLWVAHRRPGQDWMFDAPRNVGPGANSEFNEYGPALTPEGETLYFASNRPSARDEERPDEQAWPATVREDLYRHDYDLYRAPVTPRGIGQAQPMVCLNTPQNEGSPALSPAGDFLYFSSDRPGGYGGFDLYRSRWVHGGHEPPSNLGEAVNTSADELDPGLSMGGYALYFSSNRPGAPLPPEAERHYDIYRTTSREVFTEVKVQQASINWALLWSRFGANLLWALLALLLILLMLALAREARNRQLSLLARCLMASIFLHLLLMLAFNFWEVTVTLARTIGRGGGVQIALVPPARGDDIAAQIRGGLTELMEPGRSEAARLRSETSPEIRPATVLAEVRMERPPIEFDERSQWMGMVSDVEAAMYEAPAPEAIPTADRDTALVEVTLPEANERIESEEVGEIGRNEMAELPPPGRSRLAEELTHPQVKPTTVSLMPTDRGKTSEPGEGQLSFEAFAARDALSRFDAPAPRGEIEPMVSAARDLDVALPAVSARGAGQVEERATTLRATVPETLRRDKALAPEPRPPAGRVIRIAPAVSTEQEEDASLIREVEAAATRRPAQAMPTPQRRTGATLTPPAPAEISLALPGEVHRDSQSQERGPQIAAASERAVRADLDPGVARPSIDSELFAVAPRTRASELGRRADGDSLAPIHTPTGDHSGTRAVELRHAPTPVAVSEAPAVSLRLPAETRPLSRHYAQRGPEYRRRLLEQMGGSEGTESAVALALQWLAAHQAADGGWDGDEFDVGCGRCGGAAVADVDVGVTGLSLLCFLGAGHAHLSAGPYQENVNRALRYLLRRQSADGDLGGDESAVYSHGIATVALSEAYGMTGDPRLLEPARRAVRFLCQRTKAPEEGWPHEPAEAGPRSTLGWQILALRSAELGGLHVPDQVFDAAVAWLDRLTVPSRPGVYCPVPGTEYTPAMTAEGMFAQQLLGMRREDVRLKGSAECILSHLPEWGNEGDTRYWYYGTMALHQYQGPAWRQWNAALSEMLLGHQERGSGVAGSWEPIGEQGEAAGRVFQTAMCTLMLEVYYRYLPAFSPVRPEDMAGTISGRVTDGETGEPLAGATVRLDLPRDRSVQVETRLDGTYLLDVPAAPDFFALSAGREGYVPDSVNLSRARLRHSPVIVDFELDVETVDVLVVEADPEVHHLGNNEFEGRINSQFQKESEGDTFVGEFELTAEQFSERIAYAEIRMLAKGAQCRNRIRINGTRIRGVVTDSPPDGSFGELIIPLDVSVLRVGVNIMEIEARTCRSDLDDFEFVNIQVRLSRESPEDEGRSIPLRPGQAEL